MRLNWKPPRVFYGWWIVSASVLIALYVGGVVFYGFTAIFEPIADDLGWSYTQISLAASLRGLEVGLLAPFIGILVDRWGPRRVLFGGAVVTAMGLTLLSYTTSLAIFYGAFILIAVGMSCCTTGVLMTAIANWFRRRVGIASGISASGFGLSGLLIPVIVRLIELYDWRMTMTILAVGTLAVVLPLSLLFRHKPEQYGYLPDGNVEGTVTVDNSLSAPSPIIEVEISPRQALKNSIFWRISLAFTSQLAMVTATVTHVMPYLSSIGIARTMASLVATGIPLLSVGGRLGIGWLGDKIEKKRVAAGAFVITVSGLVCFEYASAASSWLLLPFLILFGIGYGGLNVLRASLSREYFGRANFGTIFGLMIGINMLGSILGPAIAGWVYDNWGSYQGVWLFFAGLNVAALIAILTIPSTKTAGL